MALRHGYGTGSDFIQPSGGCASFPWSRPPPSFSWLSPPRPTIRSARLVGRSHECDWPDGAGLESLPVLTASRTAFTSSAEVDAAVRNHLESGQSLYTLDEAKLAALEPNLILTQDLCDVCSIDLGTVRRIAERLSPQPQVLSLNPETLEDVFDDAFRIGDAIGMKDEALELTGRWHNRIDAVQDHVPAFAPPKQVVFLEWTDPLFIGGHWTPQLIERTGGSHALNPALAAGRRATGAGPAGQSMRRAGKSIRVDGRAVAAVGPEVLLIAPCGLDLPTCIAEADKLVGQDWFESLPAVRARTGGTNEPGSVWCINGNQMFNRPGPRLIDAFAFLVGIINNRPELIPSNFPAARWRR